MCVRYRLSPENAFRLLGDCLTSQLGSGGDDGLGSEPLSREIQHGSTLS